MLFAHLKAIEEQARWCHLFGSTLAQVSINNMEPTEEQVGRAQFLTDASFAFAKIGDNFLVGKEVLQAVSTCAENVPNDIEWEESWLPTDCGWMYFEQPVPFKVGVWDGDAQCRVTRPLPLFSIAWGRTEEGKTLVILYLMLDDDDPNCPETSMTYMVVQQGETISEHVASMPDRQSLVRWAYSLFYVMAQPKMVESNLEKASSLARSIVSRKSKAPVRPDVRIITLRRRIYNSEPSGNHRDIDWSCRWVVGADFKHWRNQFYSSTKTHKLIHIPPFIKGPADKPLKQPTKTIYQVTR